jgi:hypothetical protein
MRYIAASVAISILLFATVAWAGDPGSDDPQSAGLPLEGGTMSGSIDMAGNDIKNLDGSYQDNLTADTLPRASRFQGQNSWSQSTTAANYVGAPVVVSGGVGAKYVTISNVANLTGDTLVVHVMDQDGTVASGGANTLTESAAAGPRDVNCVGAGLTTAQCACAYYTVINTGVIAGVTASRTDGTCSDSKFFIECNSSVCAATSAVYTSGGTVGLTVTMRLSGPIVSPNNIRLYQSGTSPNLTTHTCLGGGSGLFAFSADCATAGPMYASAFNHAVNFVIGATDAQFRSAYDLSWSSTTAASGTPDVGIARASAGVIGFTDGSLTTNVVLTANYGRLGSATIDTSSAAAQTIFTVPAGRVAYPQRVVVRDPSAAITVAVLTMGFDAGCTDFLAAADITALTGATSTAGFSPANGALTVEGAAAAVFCVDTSAQEAAADTVVVDVFGELL